MMTVPKLEQLDPYRVLTEVENCQVHLFGVVHGNPSFCVATTLLIDQIQPEVLFIEADSHDQLSSYIIDETTWHGGAVFYRRLHTKKSKLWGRPVKRHITFTPPPYHEAFIAKKKADKMGIPTFCMDMPSKLYFHRLWAYHTIFEVLWKRAFPGKLPSNRREIVPDIIQGHLDYTYLTDCIKVSLHDRDIYMSHKIRSYIEEHKPKTALVICGAAHIQGIVQRLTNPPHPNQVKEVCSYPYTISLKRYIAHWILALIALLLIFWLL